MGREEKGGREHSVSHTYERDGKGRWAAVTAAHVVFFTLANEDGNVHGRQQ